MKKSLRIITAILTIATLFISCKKDDKVIVYGNAKFRLINAVQGSTSQDFYQGETKLNTTALAYGEVSDYITVKAGSSTVSFKSFDTQTVSASGNVGVNTDMNYTVFYTKNSTGGGEINGYPETTATPPAGKAGVRFVNLGATLTTGIMISFATGESLITSPLVFGAATGYAVLDPAVEHKFAPADQLTNSTSIPAATFQSGKLYTVWFDAINPTTPQYHLVVQN